jgi:hypothetical protein
MSPPAVDRAFATRFRGAALTRLEGLYNPVGQQRGGLLWGLLRRERRRDREHPVIAELETGAFNTNPVLAGYLAGALAARLARDARACDPLETREAVERIRSTLAPLLSGVGDRLVWGGLRPALSLFGILSGLLLFGEPGVWYWLGYNGAQWYWRRRSWAVGLGGEAAVVREMRGLLLERWTSRLARAGRFLLGLTIGVSGMALFRAGPGFCLVFLAICGGGVALARSGRVPPLALGWIAVTAAGLLLRIWTALGTWTPFGGH